MIWKCKEFSALLSPDAEELHKSQWMAGKHLPNTEQRLKKNLKIV